MTTSDLLSRMYQPPLKALSVQQQMLMQKLHLMPGSRAMATTAPNVRSCNGSPPISSSCIAPYLHRVYWFLTNSKNAYLAGIEGRVLQFAASANAVPAELRFCSHERVKALWLSLRTVSELADQAIAITPVDFYAHRSTPHLWCALDD